MGWQFYQEDDAEKCCPMCCCGCLTIRGSAARCIRVVVLKCAEGAAWDLFIAVQCVTLLCFSWLNSPGQRRWKCNKPFAIHAYYRFKDDIWILAGDRSLARRFISRFRDLASRVFESELVECSAKCVEMIGVIITIEGNKIHTEPRPQDKVPPLSQQSAHPLKVHLRWPAAYMRAELEFVFNRSKKGTCEKVSLSKDFNKAMLQKQRWMH